MDSSYAVNSLLDKGLIEAAGRLDAPGRPMLYVTTDKFLRVFGLNALDELPETEALSVAAAQIDGEQTDQGAAEAEQLELDVENETVPKDYTEPVDDEEPDVAIEAHATAPPPPQSDEKEDLP